MVATFHSVIVVIRVYLSNGVFGATRSSLSYSQLAQKDTKTKHKPPTTTLNREYKKEHLLITQIHPQMSHSLKTRSSTFAAEISVVIYREVDSIKSVEDRERLKVQDSFPTKSNE